jgi:hypothetical protein
MNTKLATRFTAVAIATTAVFGIAASSANAATLTCNAANKGKVVKTKVCSFEKGRYAWLTVVPSAPATAAATESAPIKGVTFSPADGSFTATILPTWKIATKEPTFVIAYSKDIWDGQYFSSTEPSFVASTFDYSSGGVDLEAEMNSDADDMNKNGRTVLAREVITVKGRNVARFVWIQNDVPEISNMTVLITTRDGKKLVKMTVSYVKGKANSARHKAEIEQMIAGMIVQ